MRFASIYRNLFPDNLHSRINRIPRRMIRVDNTDLSSSAASTFTILTNNCLAEGQYFPRTNPAHLAFSYRSKLFEKQFQSLNADILCLQEMHQDDFKDWLRPFRGQLGYDQGTFAEHGGDKAKDGLVTFFKRDKFQLIAHHRLGYFDSAQA